MYTITGYAIAPSTSTVTVALRYMADDPINGEVERHANLYLPDGEGDLASPNWSDDDLIAATAASIGCAVSDVTLETI